MIPARVTVPRWSMSQITTLNWSFERDIAFYAMQGVKAVGISVAKLRAIGVDRAEGLLRDAGMAVSCLTTAGPLDYSGTSIGRQRNEDAGELLRTASRLGAGCVMLMTGSDPARSWEENALALRPLLEDLLKIAERERVRIALEPTHALRVDTSFIHSFGDALDLVDSVDSPWLGVVLEVNNAWIEPRLYRNIAERMGRIFLVQVNDFRIGTLTTPQRVVMGDGHIPLRRILHALRAVKYDGWYDIELIGPEIEAEGYESVVPRSIRAFEALWT